MSQVQFVLIFLYANSLSFGGHHDRMIIGFTTICAILLYAHSLSFWGQLDHMVIGFTTTCAISAYHHSSCEFESSSWPVVLDKTLCDKVCV